MELPSLHALTLRCCRFAGCGTGPAAGTTYDFGEGLTHDEASSVVSVDGRYVEALAKAACIDTPAELAVGLLAVGGGAASCPDGSVLEFNGTSWACASGGGFSGAYDDLTGAPDLSVFAMSASLAPVATSGAYADLSGTPMLSAVAVTGAWADLSGRPTLSPIATSGSYADLTNRPQATWETNGSYIYAVESATPIPTEDQRNSVWHYVCSQSSPTFFQSFRAGISGPLMSVSVGIITPASDVTLRIREGEGHGGAVLYTGQISISGNGNDTWPISGVNVVAGSQYSITFERPAGPDFHVLCHDLNIYPPGSAGGTNPLPLHDYPFTTAVGVIHPVVVTDDSRVGVGTASPTAPIDVDVDGDAIRLRKPRTPPSGSACATGEMSWDSGFVDVCIATNTWRRAALAAY